jgi:hypothetical protein
VSEEASVEERNNVCERILMRGAEKKEMFKKA